MKIRERSSGKEKKKKELWRKAERGQGRRAGTGREKWSIEKLESRDWGERRVGRPEVMKVETRERRVNAGRGKWSEEVGRGELGTRVGLERAKERTVRKLRKEEAHGERRMNEWRKSYES